MLTPLDIENKRFSKQMVNGYSVEEVDDFLDELTVEYSKNYKEVSELRAKVEELNNSLVQYKTIESTLQNTLVMAQTTAEEVKNVAKQQAEQVISEAQKEAETIIRNAKENASKGLDEIEQQTKAKEQQFNEVKQQFDIYRAKMESLLVSQSEIIKQINQDEE